MSKRFKIFLIILTVVILIFAGFKFYQWVNRPELEITVVFKDGISMEEVSQLISKIKGKIKDTPWGCEEKEKCSVYFVHLPWYLDLFGYKSRMDAIRELKSYSQIKEVFYFVGSQQFPYPISFPE